MSASCIPPAPPGGLDVLRVELPDLAYDLERQGRLDAADVVMMLHARVRELSAGSAEARPPGNAVQPTVSTPEKT